MAKDSQVRTAGIIGYLRVSTEEQAVSGLGLTAQKAAIDAEAGRRGLPVIAYCEDAGLSGKSLKRPGLTTALEKLSAGDGSVLIVAKLDRLSRSVHDATGLMQRADHEGWGLVALDAQIDTSTPQGAAMVQVMAVFAELERRLIGERTKAALNVRRAQGKTLGRPRTVTGEVAARIRDEHSAGLTWSAIARGLNEDGTAPPRGQRWYPASVRLIGIREVQPSDPPEA